MDFCFIIDGQLSIPLKEWMQVNQYRQEYCGLVNMNHTKGVYALFYDVHNYLNYHGIIKNEESNEVSLSSIPKGEYVLQLFFIIKKVIHPIAKNIENIGIG